ncbi:hypothetical protein [Streptomyces sp. G1]|uniref:hypothetical protein n=1 Tax=Streptomyces sp. G1 TaxID=361572 RepID=UPI00202FC214|nr:hypothetical protein [Streptomyces sp. G1]MCM1964892.1 hypothetical protein [Streptomyces sp. G1]
MPVSKLPARPPVTLTGCQLCNVPAPEHRDDQWAPEVGRHAFATPAPADFKQRLPEHDRTTAPLPAGTRARVLAELLAHATTAAETNAVRRVLMSAAYGWRCRTCNADHFPTAAVCGACGQLRPARVQ